ncbi:diacylglycerol kinase family protein [Paenibacillus daejeonensis]|uniref:diacylglycerol kinase family protein n=1 Tax=Paenibacillus daejeonensis TaxID=135193 RepID=UPI001FE1512E|nr:diacylglycerol kinase family protein [Paenibacillus daejeonensis]
MRQAGHGIAYALRNERHMRFHVGAAAAVMLLAALLQLRAGDWALLIGACVLVLSAELLNTAIEKAVDLAMPEQHPLARVAKDAAAGAVLIAAIGAALIGLLVLGPPLLSWLRTGGL